MVYENWIGMYETMREWARNRKLRSPVLCKAYGVDAWNCGIEYEGKYVVWDSGKIIYEAVKNCFSTWERKKAHLEEQYPNIS